MHSQVSYIHRIVLVSHLISPTPSFSRTSEAPAGACNLHKYRPGGRGCGFRYTSVPPTLFRRDIFRLRALAGAGFCIYSFFLFYLSFVFCSSTPSFYFHSFCTSFLFCDFWVPFPNLFSLSMLPPPTSIFLFSSFSAFSPPSHYLLFFTPYCTDHLPYPACVDSFVTFIMSYGFCTLGKGLAVLHFSYKRAPV